MPNDQLQELTDGMTQDERRIQALDPGYIKIDDRKINDLLKFMTDLSAQINFFNENDQIDGDWQDFFKSDINILVLLITKYDLTTQLIRFEKLESKIQTSVSDQEAITAYRNLFEYIFDMVTIMSAIREKLAGGIVHNKVAEELAGIISGFEAEISLLVSHYNEALDKLGKILKIETPPYLEDRINTDPAEKDLAGEHAETRYTILQTLPIIKETFNNLRTKYNNFLAVTAFYFKDHQISREEYHPHLALCITFLHLFQYVQDQMNSLTKDHLDFYYRQVLGLQPKDAVPDSVHVIFDPATREQVSLKQGEELLAELEGEAVYYAINEDLIVTQARVTELKTVFLDEHTQIIATDLKDKDVNETEVYKASYKNIQPADLLKNPSAVKTWSILGESQLELSDEDRTMSDTDIGILLSSPVFYLHEGNRTLTITLFFEPAAFIRMIEYFRNYAKVTGKQLQTVSYELLSDAFVISYTSSQTWEDVKRYGVKINMAENSIEIKFELSPVDPVVDSYNKEVHGENYEVEWPVVKVLLNNYSTHNPFSFFRKLILKRITITADVQGSRNVKLQNNVGNLSPDNPFHPFGPQPGVGSYLDIKNTNIFNRFTKDFCIRIEWIDLPKNDGGWEDYYKEYKANFTNDSFKIRLSAMSQGKFKPALSRRQEFKLFEMERGDQGEMILSDTSEINQVDLKKLELPNKPLLAAEALPDPNFTEGAIRLEFSSPKEAFGSRIYPHILSETVMHNSGRFSSKRALPNVPNVPVIRSITIDYTLEHSEVLMKTFNNDDSALKVIHQYPFGYDNVYPESDKQPYPFIPDFEYENNLYIGISNLYPQQDLSLLFQLKEQNFTDTARDPAPVIWSYLYHNSWIDFDMSDILYDTTNNFINTGIIKIRLPEDVLKGNTRLSSDLYWLRASTAGQSNVMSKMIGVYPHAVTASRIFSSNKELTELKLPPDTIRQLKNKIPGLANVFQLSSSFGGRPAETSQQFYIRVSERLRHKKRLISSRDIEQAILDEFPQILMAKCISEDKSGDNFGRKNYKKIRIIVVAGEQDAGYLNMEQPKANLAVLYQIKTFIKAAVSPFIDIEVENPVYERIKIVAKIKYKGNKSTERGLFTQKLSEDIRKYLCPWLYESRSSFKIGSEIYITEILNYIKKRPYVEYVTGFSVLHFYNWINEETGELLSGINDFASHNKASIKGSVPEAVIIPSNEHLITVLEEAEYSEAARAGIGSLLIAEELLVYDNKLSVEEEIKEKKTSGDDDYFNLFISHDFN